MSIRLLNKSLGYLQMRSQQKRNRHSVLYYYLGGYKGKKCQCPIFELLSRRLQVKFNTSCCSHARLLIIGRLIMGKKLQRGSSNCYNYSLMELVVLFIMKKDIAQVYHIHNDFFFFDFRITYSCYIKFYSCPLLHQCTHFKNTFESI